MEAFVQYLLDISTFNSSFLKWAIQLKLACICLFIILEIDRCATFPEVKKSNYLFDMARHMVFSKKKKSAEKHCLNIELLYLNNNKKLNFQMIYEASASAYNAYVYFHTWTVTATSSIQRINLVILYTNVLKGNECIFTT